MAFDVTLQPLTVNILAPDPEQLAPDETAQILFAVTVGLQLPFEQAPGQPIVVPLGMVRIPFAPGVSVEIGKSMVENGERFPDKPSIDIARSLDGLDQAQRFERKLRGDE